MASQDTEITLGIGKLAGLFFALSALCAVFLALGYSLGKSSMKNAAASSVDAPQSATSTSSPKPSAHQSAPAQPQTKQDLTFYKAVEQKAPDSKLAPAEDDSAARASTNTASPELTRSGSGYVVQVAAVSKQEDAQALAEALKKKSYAVLISTNPPNDKLYHVQVGPFTDVAEAETTRNRLVNDGYNPILKK